MLRFKNDKATVTFDPVCNMAESYDKFVDSVIRICNKFIIFLFKI